LEVTLVGTWTPHLFQDHLEPGRESAGQELKKCSFRDREETAPCFYAF
jgi:hypothetical protein